MWYHIFTFRISKFRRKKTLKRFRYFRSLFVVVEVINKNHILSIRLDFEEGERERVEKIKKKNAKNEETERGCDGDRGVRVFSRLFGYEVVG